MLPLRIARPTGAAHRPTRPAYDHMRPPGAPRGVKYVRQADVSIVLKGPGHPRFMLVSDLDHTMVSRGPATQPLTASPRR
jgi:hypothetical protein